MALAISSSPIPVPQTTLAVSNRPNSVDYRPLLRAALVNLDRWVTEGQAPPPSLHPRLDDGTAVPPAHTAATFQALPGVQFPAHLRSIARLDFGPGVHEGDDDAPAPQGWQTLSQPGFRGR